MLTIDSYHAEPSGTFYRYDAKAIGSGSEGAQAELVNEYHKYVLQILFYRSTRWMLIPEITGV